jgi:hypothetical protein
MRHSHITVTPIQRHTYTCRSQTPHEPLRPHTPLRPHAPHASCSQVSTSAARGLVTKYDVRPDGVMDVHEFASLVSDLEGAASGLLLPPPRDERTLTLSPRDGHGHGHGSWRGQKHTVAGGSDAARYAVGASSLEGTHQMSSRLLAAEANAAAAAAELARVRNEMSFRELS